VTDALTALRSSVDRLTALVAPLDDDAVARSAYPKEWSIADVLSHLGSAAVIFHQRIDDALAGRSTPDELSQAVWDEWNAKAPRAKAADGLAAIDAAATQLESTSPADAARFEMPIGPLVLDWSSLVGMRLNEQVVHEWDVAVALDPTATLAADGTDVVIDNLDLIARFTAKPTGTPRTITVATADPERTFEVNVQADAVSCSPADGGSADLALPAEAFIRLVYGRLDPDHTPAIVTIDAGALEQLRAVFPGP
jgi:uncharacterized protein (TIGR03083 family)